jgi:hypothetical protein
LTALRRWWVIAAAVLLGGLVGWSFHALRPTVYEARFEVLLNLDQVSSGELERFEEDIAFDAAGVILGGPQTVEQAAAAAVEAGIPVTPAELAEMSSVERRRSTWMVRVRDTDPQRAKRLAEIWLETGYAELQDAYGHAQQAERLQRSLNSLENCLARTANSTPAEGLCGLGSLAALQLELEHGGILLIEEQLAARGLPGFIMVGAAERAVVPPRAVANQRGFLVMAGALIGLVLGIWASQVRVRPRQER